MPEALNYELVRNRLIKTRKRRDMTLRDVAGDIKLSAATLSRFEKKKGTPDLPTLRKLADWLALDWSAVTGAPNHEPEDTPARVTAHLRADKNLDRDTAEALARSFEDLYRTFAGNASK